MKQIHIYSTSAKNSVRDIEDVCSIRNTDFHMNLRGINQPTDCSYSTKEYCSRRYGIDQSCD